MNINSGIRSYYIYMVLICAMSIWAMGTLFQGWQSSPSSSDIKVLYSYADLHISCDVNTLITFDVDDTLIMSADQQQLNYSFSNVPLLAKIYALFRYPSLVLHYEYVTSLLFAHSLCKVTEPIVASMINQCKRKFTVLGLTSMESGHWGIIETMPEWRFNMLATMGITFSEVPDQTFNHLPERRTTYPILYKGILCTNQEPKSVVLGAYVDELAAKPVQIIAFDDDYDALCSIEQMCKKRTIAFQGYHYVYAKRQKKMLTCNEALKELSRFAQSIVY